jgi:hypothetical protein
MDSGQLEIQKKCCWKLLASNSMYRFHINVIIEWQEFIMLGKQSQIISYNNEFRTLHLFCQQ